jgi:hypothetical protein
MLCCILGPQYVLQLRHPPVHRREQQLSAADGDELEAVKKYFNTDGYQRWRKIYGETDEVNKVQLDIRQGHAQTVDKVLRWLDEEGNVKGTTFADAGCGTGTSPLFVRVLCCVEGQHLPQGRIHTAAIGATAHCRQPCHPTGTAWRDRERE